MISKWKYNYTDEEKGMALTIQNLKQEIDKLVDANEDINREFSQYKYESKKEIERLNNIINEFEKWLVESIEKHTEDYLDWKYDKNVYLAGSEKLQNVLDKLQELKGDNNVI